MLITILATAGALITGTGIGGLCHVYGKEMDEKIAAKKAAKKAEAEAAMKEEYERAQEINEEISYAKVADIQLELYEVKKAKADLEEDMAKIDEKISYLQREAHKAVKEAREYEKQHGIIREV